MENTELVNEVVEATEEIAEAAANEVTEVAAKCGRYAWGSSHKIAALIGTAIGTGLAMGVTATLAINHFVAKKRANEEFEEVTPVLTKQEAIEMALNESEEN